MCQVELNLRVYYFRRLLPPPVFHLLRTKRVFREVIDTEGRVFEPLEHGHERIVWGPSRLNNQVEERFVAPLRDPFRGSRSKVSRTRPLCLSPLAKDVFDDCPTGVDP